MKSVARFTTASLVFCIAMPSALLGEIADSEPDISVSVIDQKSVATVPVIGGQTSMKLSVPTSSEKARELLLPYQGRLSAALQSTGIGISGKEVCREECDIQFDCIVIPLCSVKIHCTRVCTDDGNSSSIVYDVDFPTTEVPLRDLIEAIGSVDHSPLPSEIGDSIISVVESYSKP